MEKERLEVLHSIVRPLNIALAATKLSLQQALETVGVPGANIYSAALTEQIINDIMETHQRLQQLPSEAITPTDRKVQGSTIFQIYDNVYTELSERFNPHFADLVLHTQEGIKTILSFIRNPPQNN